MHFVLYAVGTIIALVFGLFYFISFSIVWMLKFLVLTFVPISQLDAPITLNNYDSLPTISREYYVHSQNKYNKHFFDVLAGKRSHKLKGKYALRSDGVRVYIINASDDKEFGQNKDIEKVETKTQNWALRSCRNNIKGCGVNVSVEYKFNGRYPYQYNLNLTRR